MTVITVSGPSDPLWTTLYRGAPKVLNDAQPGDVIVLGAGSYPALNPGFNVGKAAPGVTIRSAPNAEVEVKGAAFTAGGWNLAGIRFTAGVALSGSGFDLDNLEIAGVAPADLTSMTGTGLSLRNASNVIVTNSDIHHWQGAIVGLGINGLKVLNCTLHHTSSDIVHLGGDVSNLEFGGNTLHSAFAATSVHGDGLQIFSNGATRPRDNIWIYENHFRRGAGIPLQGAFLDGVDQPATNVRIVGNVFEMDDWWGVGLQACVRPLVDGNYVTGSADSGMTPWIKLMQCDSPAVTNNHVTCAPLLVGCTGTPNVSGNTIIPLHAPGDDSAANAWLAQRFSAGVDLAALTALQAKIAAAVAALA